MGAMIFKEYGEGKDMETAFWEAVRDSLYENGHAGYSGTLAEKDSFVKVIVPNGIKPEDYAEKMIEVGDPRIDDKWGPAGGIHVKDNLYLFFGWASS